MSFGLEERHRTERDFHDRAALHERHDFYTWGALRVADQFAFALLGPMQGRVVLDLGCGDGANSLRFAEGGACVQAIDISSGMADVTNRRAEEAGLQARISASCMSAEHVGFPDQTFDLVFGHSVLHHTDLMISRREIHRILKPGGRAIFLEPLAHNPLIAFFRWMTPWRRTPTERPLRFADIAIFAEPFARVQHHEFYLLSLLAFAVLPLGSRRLFQVLLDRLSDCDRSLLDRWPVLGRYAWVTVIELAR